MLQGPRLRKGLWHPRELLRAIKINAEAAPRRSHGCGAQRACLGSWRVLWRGRPPCCCWRAPWPVPQAQPHQHSPPRHRCQYLLPLRWLGAGSKSIATCHHHTWPHRFLPLHACEGHNAAHSRLHQVPALLPAVLQMNHVRMFTKEHVRPGQAQSVTVTPPGGEQEGGSGGRRLSSSLLLVSIEGREGLQGVPLANGAQRLAGRQPLVDALQMEAVLAGQHSQLLPIPAAWHASSFQNPWHLSRCRTRAKKMEALHQHAAHL